MNRTPWNLDVTATSAMAEVRQGQSTSNWLRRLHQLLVELAEPTYDSTRIRAQSLQLLHGTYLPRVQASPDTVVDLHPTALSWVKAVCNMDGPSDSLDHSLLAFCAIQVRLTGEVSLSYEDTVQLYNKALRKVIQDLNGERRSTEETVAAIVVLSTCEVCILLPPGYAADAKKLFVFSKDQSWSAHAQGISELLRHRDVLGTPSRAWKSLCIRTCVICVSISSTPR